MNELNRLGVIFFAILAGILFSRGVVQDDLLINNKSWIQEWK